MSMTVDPPGRPRRGRPPARNEILQAGRLAGLDPRELAERFGTPLYVYDLGVIDRQVAALRAALPDRVDLAYAVKANPSLAIVAHLAPWGSARTSRPGVSWPPPCAPGSRPTGSS